MTFSNAVGLRLKNLLKERNMTLYRFTKISGILRSTLEHIIGSKSYDVKLSTIYSIASTFNITIKEFFNDKLFDNFDFKEVK